MDAEIAAIRQLKKMMFVESHRGDQPGEEGVGACPDHSRPVDSHNDVGLVRSVLLQGVLGQQDISVHV